MITKSIQIPMWSKVSRNQIPFEMTFFQGHITNHKVEKSITFNYVILQLTKNIYFINFYTFRRLIS